MMHQTGVMQRSFPVALLLALTFAVSGVPAFAQDAPAPSQAVSPEAKPTLTIVEECLLAPTGRLATVDYRPNDAEKPIYEKAGFPRDAGDPLPVNLSVKAGDTVSWFALVRDIFEDKSWPDGRILGLQVLYFEGMTDEHLQTVSINGPGDAIAELRGKGEALIPLMLVRVYGRVTAVTQAGIPIIEADFVRYWPWGMFNFRDYGEDHSDPVWRKGTKIGEVRMYTGLFINMDYYVDRIGGTDEQIEAQLRWHDENRARVKAFIESHMPKKAEETSELPFEVMTGPAEE
jgi:hypothetical protein